MNWEQEVYIDHNRVKLKMEKGYKYLVSEDNPKPYDVDNDTDDYLYSLVVDTLDVKSYYHVGFSMGRTLVNVTRLLPKIKVGGITWFDHSIAFGQQLFNLSDYHLEIQAGEYPYKPINGKWDFIHLGRLPFKSNLGGEILAKACEDTNKYVFFFNNVGHGFIHTDEFECEQDFDSGLEYVPVLLTKNSKFDIKPGEGLVPYNSVNDLELLKNWPVDPITGGIFKMTPDEETESDDTE